LNLGIFDSQTIVLQQKFKQFFYFHKLYNILKVHDKANEIYNVLFILILFIWFSLNFSISFFLSH